MVRRIVELDALRAILIFFVVFGHSQCCLDQVPVVRELIYSFHMPALFTLSGLVTALSWRGDAARKIGRSAWRLLVPYVLCGALFLPVWIIIWEGGGWNVFQQSLADCFLHNRGLWYLPACFLLVCSFVLMEMSVERLERGGRVLVCCLFFLAVAGIYAVTRCDFLRSVLSYWFSFYVGVALARRP